MDQNKELQELKSELNQANSLLQEAHKRIKELEKDLDEEKQKSSSIMKQSLREKEELLVKISALKQEQGQHKVKDCQDASVQFDYLIPHSDSLDSSFITVGSKLFHLQGDTHRSFQWEKYGFRLHCPEGAVSKDTEVAVTAIAGGNFIVPKGTMLVSAVYAISVSKPLLQPLVIEMQHCVDLRYEGQTRCLKFVETPMKYPYQFIPIEGGSFRVGNRYGSLTAIKFCLNAIVAEMSNGDRDSSKNLETPSEDSKHDVMETDTSGVDGGHQ
ncbi:PREDICTED: uncharacterized protein LOC100635815 [Amphimedon queenslandica]|uniref:Uncharacterized protein n=1 Tax=Amphimedon queenslandica TaxID=400682 RepID=A0A1X7V1I4_AMPQE|nr:PREDICTED: uncharacterized protein LOC100635815 [Amphimedon queenslandica]|eukprot:XP_003386018.1 PREDICTED: uncharacterized protein LOC100635815 [Amphimedon queenslandica]